MGWLWERRWVQEGPDDNESVHCLVAKRGGEVCECCRSAFAGVKEKALAKAEVLAAADVRAVSPPAVESDASAGDEEAGHHAHKAPIAEAVAAEKEAVAVAEPAMAAAEGAVAEAEEVTAADPAGTTAAESVVAKAAPAQEEGVIVAAPSDQLKLTLIQEGRPPMPLLCPPDETAATLQARVGIGATFGLAKSTGVVLVPEESLVLAGLKDGDEVLRYMYMYV